MPWCRSETIAVEEDDDERSIREEQSRSHETNDAVEVGLDTEIPKNGPTIYWEILLKILEIFCKSPDLSRNLF